MTHTAETYVRTGRGPHRCPDAFDAAPHNLIEHPERGNPHIYVCPYDYDQERGEKYRERIAAEEAAERAAAQKERAEAIAAELAEEYGIVTDTADERISSHGEAGSIREMLTAAALAGMTGTEAAR